MTPEQLELQRQQSIDHLRELTTALVAYAEAINLALTIKVKIAGNGKALDHHAAIDINDPDATMIEANTATAALHSLMTLCTFNAWPGYLRAPVERSRLG